MNKTIISEFGLDKIGHSQSTVEFLNVKLEFDNLAFLDYNKVLKFASPLTLEMKKSLDAFLNQLFQSVVFNKPNDTRKLLKGLHESNQTRLGFSSKRPHGNSVGSVLKQLIQDNTEFVINSLKTGQFSYNTLYFGIDQVGPDRISDIIVSIIKSQLITFTQEQCTKHGIPTKAIKLRNVFNYSTKSWENGTFDLPVFDGLPIIFIPKKLISSDSGLVSSYNRFLRYGFTHFVKNNTEYAFLMDEKNKEKGVKKKDYEAYLKTAHISNKDQVKKWIISNKTAILDFESELDPHITLLSDKELEEVVNRLN
ncbi:hypothetical protein SAMN04488511_1187 [Pedobacter suwonensis]|uniref:Uncharacterized protein n=1 Tax=Pedobacter suwonensis TaxID=332999 RepID=A0A1I0U0Z0_9SPHI|nr:hypothetical protein [Pedobacter suwonensis]SFA57801.1 hypothetical protein SAMN04488511_1187 [Pedobacter suwonensis]